MKEGQTALLEVPAPMLRPGHVLIENRSSVISAGTERMLVEFGRASYLQKARQQPDKVRQVLEKVRIDGVLPTLRAVQAKLDEPLPLGYSSAGVVRAVGAGVTEFLVGDRVVSNGPHAELVCVPRNLVAKIPDATEPVPFECAAFTVVAAIGLQGIRLAAPTLGETFVVLGLGLIGLMTVQMLRAQGCRVIGADFDPAKLAFARGFGAETIDLGAGEDPVAAALAFTGQRGVDGVLITASTKSNAPVRQAAQMCRKRGRIVLVGVTGLELSRADFYEKELTFQVSCSYGPGRYDPAYEQGGQDYPLGFVRWTEQRNFEAVLDLMADRRLDVASLITHRFAIDDAKEAYELVTGREPTLGVVLEYPPAEGPAAKLATTVILRAGGCDRSAPGRPVRIAVIGAGAYANAVLVPAFRAAGAELAVVASTTGAGGAYAARKFGFARATTDVDALWDDDAIDAVVIATRHDSHVRLAAQALQAGKHVFVEKPLAIRRDDLDGLIERYATLDRRPLLTVGFNRRFAPLVARMRALLASTPGPKTFVMTVNAGAIPLDHWVHDPQAGGGRIIGEACHFVDLLRHLAASPIVNTQAMVMGGPGPRAAREDKMSIQLGFADGSFGTIHYLANGHRAFPKERLEVFAGDRILVLDNFKALTGHGWPGFRRTWSWAQDKGQRACAAAFLAAIAEDGPAPIGLAELVEVTRACFDAVDGAQVAGDAGRAWCG